MSIARSPEPRDRFVERAPRDSSELVREEVFEHLLVRERKRSERSNRPFVLLSLKGPGGLDPAVSGTGKAVVEALVAGTRGTDIVGWIEWPVAIGVIFAKVLAHRRKPTLVAGAILIIALACESLSAYPNYISFFNVAARRTAGGLALLGDSNLDWGQDLPQLARWRQQHPTERLYLAYYGGADPAAYGIDYINVSGGFFLGPPPQAISAPGVIAVSATRLQGLYMDDDLRRQFAELRAQPVREILPGGTIYVFDYPPQQKRQ